GRAILGFPFVSKAVWNPGCLTGLREQKTRDAAVRRSHPGEWTMEYFIQQLVNGLTLGSIYGLIAIGYTMVYGIIGMINFAHGDIFMLGGFAALIIFLVLTSVFVGLPT